MDWTRLSYSVVDVEGNGQQPPDLVELAVVPIVGGVIGEPKTWLVKPRRPIRHLATRVHGIGNKDVETAPTFEQVADTVRAAVDGTVVVAHNAHVDVGVLRRHLPDWVPVDVFDTLKLTRHLRPGHTGYRLGSLVEAFRLADGLPGDLHPHRATYDALVTARLFLRLATGHSLNELLDVMRGNKANQDDHAALF